MSRRARWGAVPRTARNVIAAMLDHEARHRSSPGETAGARERLAAVPGVLARIAGHSRAITSYLRSGDPALAAHLRQSLIGDYDDTKPVPSGLLGPPWRPSPGDTASPPVIVIPVFNAFDDLTRLLDRLPRSLGEAPHRILLVNDGSDDPRITPRLQDFCTKIGQQAILLTLPANLGFVGAVNAGLERAQWLGDGHVVLLNTDTIPPLGWLPRLLDPIESDPSVATVTPVSNTAEILSVPGPGTVAHMSDEMIARIDGVAHRLTPRARTVELPTGIGFCMAMNRDFLDRIGGFDPAFGRGYGEEVDWCQKASALGGRHIATSAVFVGHRGGASFGAEEKQTRIAEASGIITARYPGYDGAVRDWALADPISAQRLALSVAWLASATDGPVPIYLAHSLGGGAEIAMMQDIETRIGNGHGVLVIRVGGRKKWRLELVAHGVHWRGDIADDETLESLLSPVEAREVIYSCGVGAHDPRDVPKLLLRLAGPSDLLTIRFNDHFPISPSCFLLDNKDRYTGVPACETNDPAHAIRDVTGTTVGSHNTWRGLWGHVMDRANRVEVFSRATASIVATAYPAATASITVQPHKITKNPGRLAPGGQSIGVLGGINVPKGAGVVTGLARHLTRTGSNRRIVVIGELDGAFRMHRPHQVHGRYDRDDMLALAQRYEVGVWLMPSICPETFSFTMHEMLATGLPVLSFDLGAQAEAARAAPNGHVLTTEPEDLTGLSRAIEDILGA
mgnify:CR=1 FL=1